MRKLNSFIVIAVLLTSTINSPVLFSSIALSQEQTATTPTTTEPVKTETTATQPTPTTEPTSPPPEQPKVEPQPEIAVQPPPEEKPPERPTCPSPPSPIACSENQGLVTNFDDGGCVTGYDCKEIPKSEVGQVNICPEVPAPTISCKANEQMNKMTDEKGCVTGYNCISTAPPSEGRPEPICLAVVLEKPQCDGNLVPIFDKGCLTGYNCIPSGCRQEVDSSGFSRVVCMEGPKCRADEEQEKMKKDCFQQGGNPVPFQDPSGCTFYDCRFTREESTPNPITGHETCPSEESVNNAMQQCKSSGLAPRVAFDGGCKVAKCVQMRTDVCERIIEPARIAFEESCKIKGLPAVIKMDENGCQAIECGANQQDTCQTDIPPEAFKKCQEKGGEMVVKKDNRGCVAFANCVGRGDERDSYVEAVEEVPDATVLLSLALKLEHLKVELIKLSKDSGEIAKFYAAEDSIDEERYNRVSSMFDAAAGRIDEMKIKIRDSVDTMTTDDLAEIKHDIKYIKEVTLKDILYVMLSNSDDIKETLESSKRISMKDISVEEIGKNAKSCGTDGFCFDKAIRACKPVTFQPEGRNGPLVSIAGLRDKNCVLHITMQSSDQIPPGYTKDNFYMDCPIADYAVGVRGPEDILPTCEGPMAKFAKQFGGGEVTGGARFPPPEGGPGECDTEKGCAVYCIDNYDECNQWVKEHPAYGPLPSKEELKKIASGKQETIRTGPSQEVKFAGPGGCTNPRECDKFCRSNPTVCVNWCDENPGTCPEEKLEQKPKEFKEVKQAVPASGQERCECTWAGGTREHPRGCPVLCSDYSDDREVCETQANSGCVWIGRTGQEFVQTSGEKCPDGICDQFERDNPNECPQDCGGVSKRAQPAAVQACVGCLNNGVCDIGECSECIDCLKGTRSITGEIIRMEWSSEDK